MALKGQVPFGIRAQRPKPMWLRWLKFNTVGAAGVVVQIGTLWMLVELERIPYLIGALIATELAGHGSAHCTRARGAAATQAGGRPREGTGRRDANWNGRMAWR